MRTTSQRRTWAATTAATAAAATVAAHRRQITNWLLNRVQPPADTPTSDPQQQQLHHTINTQVLDQHEGTDHITFDLHHSLTGHIVVLHGHIHDVHLERQLIAEITNLHGVTRVHSKLRHHTTQQPQLTPTGAAT